MKITAAIYELRTVVVTYLDQRMGGMIGRELTRGQLNSRGFPMLVELYWSFRSPYSYIVLPRVADLRDKFQVTVDLRIVHPAAIRNPPYFARMDPLARPYFMQDSARIAAFHGMNFRRPIPDPIDQNPTTLAIATEQPLLQGASDGSV